MQFLTLLAARTAQELNYNTLANDLGISHNTVKKWYSVLEESFLVVTVPAFYRNISKRITKTPKFHFLDSGLLC
jgi:predicted AAA+ superfamily ATPase